MKWAYTALRRRNSPLAEERKFMKSPRDSKRTGAKKIADLYRQFAAETLHLDEVIAIARHFGSATLLTERVRVRILEAFASQVRVLKAEYGIL